MIRLAKSINGCKNKQDGRRADGAKPDEIGTDGGGDEHANKINGKRLEAGRSAEEDYVGCCCCCC